SIHILLSAMAGASMLYSFFFFFDYVMYVSFFLELGGSVNMQIHERLKLMPYETLVGLAITFISTLMFGFFGFAG
ncbi:gluconate:proton symporter, partial [Salmonella enterica subsp. enterica serovar Wilhelmsburg]